MRQNVGSTERYVRLAAAAVAGAAATRGTGWQRAALGAVAAAGLGTVISRYCPINHAMGRDGLHGSVREEGRRNAELRRDTAMNSALGNTPTASGGQRVTSQSDMFGRP
jgi:hypothetical protein